MAFRVWPGFGNYRWCGTGQAEEKAELGVGRQVGVGLGAFLLSVQ